jgi:hypothetical protein
VFQDYTSAVQHNKILLLVQAKYPITMKQTTQLIAGARRAIFWVIWEDAIRRIYMDMQWMAYSIPVHMAQRHFVWVGMHKNACKCTHMHT